MDYKHHIFLSYSRKDTAIMQRIRDDLRAAGLTVWTDEGIKIGTTSWKQAIVTSIRHTGCLVAILSPDAKTSRWVEEEISQAEQYNKPVFPVLARGDESDAIPFGLLNAHRVDIREENEYVDGLPKLTASICETLGINTKAEISEHIKTVIQCFPDIKNGVADIVTSIEHITLLLVDISWKTHTAEIKFSNYHKRVNTLKPVFAAAENALQSHYTTLKTHSNTFETIWESLQKSLNSIYSNTNTDNKSAVTTAENLIKNLSEMQVALTQTIEAAFSLKKSLENKISECQQNPQIPSYVINTFQQMVMCSAKALEACTAAQHQSGKIINFLNEWRKEVK